MTQSVLGYAISDLAREAHYRWLKPAEVLFLLQNYEEDQLTPEPPQIPASGSLFLFNKRVLRFFRKDGHNWRKKKDGRTVGEAHERLKVGNTEALNCYYAHGEQNPKFQRRSYWMLDPAYEHIVLVHYRDIGEGRRNSGSSSQQSSGSPATLGQSPDSYTAHPGSAAVISEPYQCLFSPGSVDASSDGVIQSNVMDQSFWTQKTEESSSSSELEVSQALQRLEEQLSLNDETLPESGPFYGENELSNDSKYARNDQRRPAMRLDCINDPELHQDSGNNSEYCNQTLARVEHEDSSTWNEILEFCKSSLDVQSQQNHSCTSDGNGIQEKCHGINFGGPIFQQNNDIAIHIGNMDLHHSALGQSPPSFDDTFALPASVSQPQEVDNFKFPEYFPEANTGITMADYFTTLFDQGRIGMHLEADSSLTIAQKQKFTIKEVSPEWGYASEATKVIIVGTFLCDPSESAWKCMFGDTEVPIQNVQDGVICCLAPPHLPGKVTLCITSGNRESCSEVREFEYLDKPSSCPHCSSTQAEMSKSPEELHLLVRFVQMLLSDPLMEKGDTNGNELGIDPPGRLRLGEDSWGSGIEALLVGSWTPTSTMDWLLQELSKDKLQQWLSSRSPKHDQLGHFLSKKEQGMIHMIAGLGFEWALSLILDCGVNIDFRDINGWTALHWAARFGREKMVAALIAFGASAGAVTDPNSQDPIGKTPAFIAAASGHKGVAGYLSEIALTSHLQSFTLEENELSKSSADVEAEITVNSISQRILNSNDDQLSLRDSLAAVRNAAQAAARIQAAFRAHSFRRRQQREAAAAAAAAAAYNLDEYGILSSDIQGLSAATKLVFGNARDYNRAATSIQKKYRGWKGRKDFLALRQKVVKIQAHVRGYQVRKQYKVIWAVGILEKIMLRWRRKGVGLRGYRNDSEFIDDSDDEEILKVFRKQKVDKVVEEAVSRVLSMVECPDARQQYRRMLERYRQVKAKLDGAENKVTSSQADASSFMENNDSFQYI